MVETDLQSTELKGSITIEGSLSGSIHVVGGLVGEANVYTGYADYSGEYEVTPSIFQQELETKNKGLAQDVIIKPIPFQKVDNIFNGQTVVIGG